MTQLGSGVSVLGSAIRGPLGIIAVAALTAVVLKQADAYNLLTDRIRRTTEDTETYLLTEQSLAKSARDTGNSIESQIRLYEALHRSRAELGADIETILGVSNAIAQLGVLSGATSTELSNASRQLSQSFSADFVRAEEFNSVIENTPAIAFEIAKGMNQTVGQLQSAVREGKILSRDVFKAIAGQAESIQKQFDDFPIRLGRAFSGLAGELTRTFSGVDKFLGTLFGADSATGSLAEVVDAITKALGEANDQLAIFNAGADVRTAQRALTDTAVAAEDAEGRFGSMVDILKILSPSFLVFETLRTAVENLKDPLETTDAQIAKLEKRLATVRSGGSIYEGYTQGQAKAEADILRQIAALKDLKVAQIAAGKLTEAELADRAERERQIREASKLAQLEQERLRRAKALAPVLRQLNDAETNALVAAQARTQIIIDNVTSEGARAELLLRNEITLAHDIAEIRENAAQKELDDEQDRKDAINAIRFDLGTQEEQIELEYAARLEQILALEGVEAETITDFRLRAEAERAEALAEAEADRREQRLEDELDAREQAFEDELARELGFADDQEKQLADQEQRHLIARLNAHKVFNREVLDLVRKGADWEKKTQVEKVKFHLDALTVISGALAGHSKAAFKVNKALRIAQTTIDTISGVMRAYVDLPWPVNIAVATAHAAFGAAQIAQIASTTFEGGGGGSISGGGGYGSAGAGGVSQTVPEAPLVTAETQEAAREIQVNLVIESGATVVTMDSEEFAQQVAPAIAQEISDRIHRGETLLPADSNNAADIREGVGG